MSHQQQQQLQQQQQQQHHQQLQHANLHQSQLTQQNGQVQPQQHPIPPLSQFLAQVSTHKTDDYTGPIVSQSNLPLCRVNNMLLSSTTVIGSRPEQQDRYVMAPSLIGGELSLFAVFDGTTGDYAAEWLRENCISTLVTLDDYQFLTQLTIEEKKDAQLIQAILSRLIQILYHTLDGKLLTWCARMSATHQPDEAFKYDYTASTGVITLIHHPSSQLCVSHVADSHAVIAAPIPESQQQQLHLFHQHQQGNNVFLPQYLSFGLTKSHKPDETEELIRIQQAGGQLVYLHDQKPFIRGKDFRLKRKAIQLNYSRAFGSKDLKHSGLISIPDITLIALKFAPNQPFAKVIENLVKNQQQQITNESTSTTAGPQPNPKQASTSNNNNTKDDDIHQLNRELDDLKWDKDQQPQTTETTTNKDNAKDTPGTVVQKLQPMTSTDDLYAVNSPSMPITNIGLTGDIGKGRNVSTPSLNDIHDVDSSNNGSDIDDDVSLSPVLPTTTINTTTTEGSTQGSTTTTTTNSNSTTTTITQLSMASLSQEEQAKRQHEKKTALQHLFHVQNSQPLLNLHDVDRLNHNPSVRIVQGSVDVKALVIGSDGVFDVLSPHEVIHTAFLQLKRSVEHGVHLQRQLQHIPINATQKYLLENQEVLIPLKNRNAISIYPDFIANNQWAHDKSWNYSPSDAIVAQALLQHEIRRSGDNVTAIVIFF